MKRFLFIALLLIGIGQMATAQDYQTALGLRFGWWGGVNLKHFVSNDAALDITLSPGWRGGLNISGLYEKHQGGLNVPNLNWYYGGGAHLGYWNNYNGGFWFEDKGDGFVLGIAGVIGLDYTFDDIPLNASLDFRPSINITHYPGFWSDFGLTLRYIIN